MIHQKDAIHHARSIGQQRFPQSHHTLPNQEGTFIIIFGNLGQKDKAIWKIFTDQTGCFLKKSSCRNQYIMVHIDVNSDAIFVEPMKNRTSGEMIGAYQTLIDHIRTAGSIPKLHILDNKCSQDFRDTIRLNGMTFFGFFAIF
jgi:hypothetical protein